VTAKQRVYRHAKTVVYNRDDKLTTPSGLFSCITSYGLSEANDGEWGLLQQQGKTYLAFGTTIVLDVEQLRLKGKHNWQNALAACALAYAAGIEFEPMRKVLRTFRGLDHRCQWVRTLDEVEWINDSKGTNVGATISAIAGIGASMSGKIVLIAGGLGKGADFRELRTSVSDFVRSVVLLGADADKIEQALADVVPITRATTLEEAVLMARTQATAGDVVLLSPACASQDMFRDFNHRGELFTQLVGLL
jgi:UDP-N-acetylmuramoylalanine--D-glutamate ligase